MTPCGAKFCDCGQSSGSFPFFPNSAVDSNYFMYIYTSNWLANSFNQFCLSVCTSPFQAPLNYLDSNWPIRVSKYSWTRHLFCPDGQCIHCYMKEDHRSYGPNFCSCKKKVWKNSGLYGITVSGLNPLQAWMLLFSGFLFATAKVASITAMIFFHITLHPIVLIYEFS